MTHTASRLLFLHAETPMHPGSGTALGAVDLPVARERHTQWPLIPGSSLKGVLRDRCYREGDRSDVFIVFGPETENASDHSGALSMSDARLLAFPVRSLRGLFAWTVCPSLLLRLQRDLRICAYPELRAAVGALLEKASALGGDKNALVSSDVLTTGVNDKKSTNMVLEEFDFFADGSPEAAAFGKVIDAVLGRGTRLATHLAVISDDSFAHYARFSTEVMARIALDYETKTVKDGALFYEEFIPTETLFYSVAIGSRPHRGEGTNLDTPDSVLAYITQKIESAPIIQIGANATTGKGLCYAAFAGGNGS